MAQVKIVASKDIVEKFKKIVLAKHGKLELSAEGEEALRLYIKKHESILNEALSAYPGYKGRLSLTDAVSNVVMKRYGMSDILSHDSDFDSVRGIRRLASA